MAASESRLRSAVEIYETHRPETLAVAAGATFTIAPLIEGSIGPISKTAGLVAAGLLFGVRGISLGARRRSAVAAAESERDEAIRDRREAERSEKRANEGIRDTLALFLRNIFERTALPSDSRISVYAFDGENGFFQLGRYAKHPPFGRTGRDYYPADEGFLGKAWLEGETYRQDIPSPEDNPDGYRAVHRQAGLSDQAIEDLTMPSRAYLGCVLFDPTGNEKVGVVMFETARPRGLIDVRARLAESDLLSLGGLILLLRPSAETAITQARRRGF